MADTKQKLPPLEAHLAWVFKNRGWSNAIRTQEPAERDFTDAPIKRWLDARDNRYYKRGPRGRA